MIRNILLGWLIYTFRIHYNFSQCFCVIIFMGVFIFFWLSMCGDLENLFRIQRLVENHGFLNFTNPVSTVVMCSAAKPYVFIAYVWLHVIARACIHTINYD